MRFDSADCCILNSGAGAWAFEPLARQLSAAFHVPVSSEPQAFNYVLNVDPPVELELAQRSFIPLPAVRLAADKRLQAAAFRRHAVPTPRTEIVETFAEVVRFVSAHPNDEWCLKYPIGCGAHGHRLIDSTTTVPAHWPSPWLVQEFVRLEHPEVHRLYGVGGELFGWNVRRFPAGTRPRPTRPGRQQELPEARLHRAHTVPHMRVPPKESIGLWDSFGAVDLIHRPSGEWLVLEVGTDGIFNHVDRELDDPSLEAELCTRLAAVFWRRANAYAHSLHES